MAVKINAEELIQILEATPANQNVMLMGKHGIGKSQILSDFFTQKGQKVVPLFLGQMSDPGDLIGLLHKNESTGRTEFMPPYWFPKDDCPVVLFLDELNRARPEILQTIMDLALNRTLAGKSLPKGSRIISAVNNGDEYQLTDLDPALVSRFNIYEFCPTASEWLLWAQKKSIDSRVIQFISHNSDYLDGDGKETEDGSLEKSPDRRAWERVSEIIGKIKKPENRHKKIIAGIIGTKTTSLFFDTLKESMRISGGDIITRNFADLEKELVHYQTPELAVINDGIFRILEAEAERLDDAAGKKAGNNIEAYYAFLAKNKRREAMAHFANMLAGTLYPNTLVFLIQNAPKLYSQVTKFIQEIR